MMKAAVLLCLLLPITLLLVGCGEEKATGDNGAASSDTANVESVASKSEEASASPESQIIGYWTVDEEKSLKALESLPESPDSEEAEEFREHISQAAKNVLLLNFSKAGKVEMYQADDEPEATTYTIITDEDGVISVNIEDVASLVLKGDTLQVIPPEGESSIMGCYILSRIDAEEAERLRLDVNKFELPEPEELDLIERGNLKYQIEGEALSITDCDEGASGKLVIPAAIEGKSVTSIGDLAFSRCTSLTSITIPDSVTSIGEKAFRECSRLTSISIPDGVTSIGASAFEDCTSLTSITIPDSVTSIGEETFEGCANLTSITIPDSVTGIGYYAFRECTSLTSITIGDSVTSIGVEAFSSCSSLTAVTFLGDAPKAGERVFSSATPSVYRKPEAKGWGETFGGRPVKLISEKP